MGEPRSGVQDSLSLVKRHLKLNSNQRYPTVNPAFSKQRRKLIVTPAPPKTDRHPLARQRSAMARRMALPSPRPRYSLTANTPIANSERSWNTQENNPKPTHAIPV